MNVNPFKRKIGLILVLAIGVILFGLVFTGWTIHKFDDITLCMTCHELFVTNEDYQPVRDGKIEIPGAGIFKVGMGCAECHMYPYEEYKKSLHFNNKRGVKPGCVGCHEPHNLIQIVRWKFLYKITGGRGETPFHVLSGSLRDFPEWEEMRVRMAKRVREGMLEENSFGCKECHDPELKDSKVPQIRLLKIKKHKKAMEEKGSGKWVNLNCIDCHYNFVHASVPWPGKTEAKKEEK